MRSPIPVPKLHPMALSASVPATPTAVDVPVAEALVSAREVISEESPATTCTSPEAVTAEFWIEAEIAPLTRLTASAPPPLTEAEPDDAAFAAITELEDTKTLSTACTRTSPPD